MPAPRRARFASTKELFIPPAGSLTDGRPSFFGDLDKMPKEPDKRAAVMDALDVGSKCDRYWIRADVARHAFATEEMLVRLASDPEVKVRRAAARHPGARSMLVSLSRDEDALVRWGVAGHPDASAEVIAPIAANDTDLRVRLAAKRSLDVIMKREVSAAGAEGWADEDGLFDGIL